MCAMLFIVGGREITTPPTQLNIASGYVSYAN
jgi:hypothetical protein